MTIDPSKVEAIRRKALEKTGGVSFAMRVENGGAFSWASEGERETARPIYSISKSFIGALTLLAHERKLLSLEDEIGRFVAGLPEWVRPMTLWELLCHRSGLSDYGFTEEYKTRLKNDPTRPPSREGLQKIVFSQGMKFERGASFLYANVGYQFVTEALEKAYGSSFSEMLARKIAEPLGLTDTRQWRTQDDLLASAPGRSNFWGDDRDVRATYSVGWSAHPQILSTTKDVISFFRAVLSGKFLSEDSIRRIRNPYRIDYPHVWYEPSYGPGFLGDVHSRYGSLLGNNGGGPGYSSSVYCREKNGEVIYACVLMGTDAVSAEDLVLEILTTQT